MAAKKTKRAPSLQEARVKRGQTTYPKLLKAEKAKLGGFAAAHAGAAHQAGLRTDRYARQDTLEMRAPRSGEKLKPAPKSGRGPTRRRK